MVLKILIFILIFFIIVVSHEFGHFIIAKANGIRVVEFSVGMGPKLIKFKRKETTYSLRLLPIGGACIFDEVDSYQTGQTTFKPGQNGDEEASDGTMQNASEINANSNYNQDKLIAQHISAEEQFENEKKQKKNFSDAPLLARFTTVLAGPLFNFILAFVLAIAMVIICGQTNTKITSVMDGFPAQEAGIQPGDEIVSINGERVYIYDEVRLISSMNQGEKLTLVVKRDGENKEYVINPKFDEEQNRYYIGFSGGTYKERNPWMIISSAYLEVRYWIKATFKSLIRLFTGQGSVTELSGPVGVATVVSDVYDEAVSYGFLTVLASMLNIAILLSANLGVINLLPLPAIDGGRILFMLIELVRGKPVPKDKEAIVHFIGFVLLLGLMIFVFYNDIARIFTR